MPEIDFAIPSQPVDFTMTTRLALTTREPFRSSALQVQPGQPLRLHREPDNPHDSEAIRVDMLDGLAVGYLYAEMASFLSILLDHYPDLTDQSYAESVQKSAPPDDPSARRHRYPVIMLHLSLHLTSAWPMFVIAAVLGIKTENFAEHFNLPGNPWLQPLQALQEQYIRLGHDQFHLPKRLARGWHYLTQERHDVDKS